jgi:serine/threonine-protein kinase
MTANRHADELRRRAEKDLRDQFRIESVLGCGEDSVVLLAKDVARGSRLALKIVAMPSLPPGLSSGDLVTRFETMASGVSSLRHSHLVPIFDYGSFDDFFWYSMQREEGPSLEVVLTGSGRLDLHRSLAIIEQTASALDFLNRRGFAHGALRPSQIFLADGKWARVADQTLSRILRPVGTSEAASSTGYEAPGDDNPTIGAAAADQYALAMIAYRCLFGSPESDAGDSPKTGAELDGEFDPPRVSPVDARGGDFPDHIVDALERALSESPQHRFASVLDFATLLRGGSWVLSNPRDRRSRAGAPDKPRAFVPGEDREPADVIKRALDAAGADRSARSILPAVREGGMLARMIHARPMAHTISIGGVAVILALAGAAFLSRGSGASSEPVSAVERPTAPTSAEQSGTINENEEPTPDPAPDSESGAASNSESQPTSESPQARPAETTDDTPIDRSSSSVATNGEPAAQEPVALEPGRLFVNSTPWGRLYIDGTLIGNTPRANLFIEPGPHVIQILRDGFEPYELEIEVLPGETIRLTEIELTPARS